MASARKPPTETQRGFEKIRQRVEKERNSVSRKAKERLRANKQGYVLRDPTTGRIRITKEQPLTGSRFVARVNRAIDFRRPAPGREAPEPTGILAPGIKAIKQNPQERTHLQAAKKKPNKSKKRRR